MMITKFIVALFGVCLCGVMLYEENALRVRDKQGLQFSTVQVHNDGYSAIFRVFDKGSTVLQSYEKLAKIHAIIDENNLNDPNDADGCACQG